MQSFNCNTTIVLHNEAGIIYSLLSICEQIHSQVSHIRSFMWEVQFGWHMNNKQPFTADVVFNTHTHTTVVSKVCIHFDRVSKFHGCLPFVRFILQNLWQDTTHYAWFIICACMYMNACLSVSLCRLSIIRCNFIYAVNLPKIFSIKAGINVFEI